MRGEWVFRGGPNNDRNKSGLSMIAPAVFTAWKKALPRVPLVDRDDYLLARASGRCVVHLGACDAPFTEELATAGKLLHQKLRAARCDSLIGVDIDAAAVELLKGRFGIDDIVVHDLSDDASRADITGDLVVCADIIEHVNNAGGLISSCNRMLPIGGELMITTVNALSFKHALRSLVTRAEIVHPDHVAYYSYATLGVLLDRFGFEATAYRFYNYPAGNRLGAFLSSVFRLFPHAANGILVEARKVRDVR